MKQKDKQGTRKGRIRQDLTFLYGEEATAAVWPAYAARLAAFQRKNLPTAGKEREPGQLFSEQDSILITYGDIVQEAGKRPLQTLREFLAPRLEKLISTVHLLPFYPYSSDDGFSVIDYRAVNPALGTWSDVTHLGRHFRLMFDAVINHMSAESNWFQAFRRGDAHYADHFVVASAGLDLSQVFRPRTLPLLTPVQTVDGEKLVWTTFSADQVDLNFNNLQVLLDILDVLLFYVAQGADYLRLDAIAYLWKEIGTPCIHLPQTHRLIQFFRAVLDEVAPHVALITETNVPHQDNIAYFGDGRNEAQLVYNFSLPPLVLHAFHQGEAAVLSNWANTLTLPSDQVTFFNFLASHDGIGVTPLRGILGEEAIASLASRVQALGGFVSYKSLPDGSQSPYELNINYLDALGNPNGASESVETMANRFLTAQAIMLALRGVPGIYFHSLFGSRSWPAGVGQTGRYRTINREKLERGRLEEELADPNGLRYRVFEGYGRLLRARLAAGRAFHPVGEQQVLCWHEAIFSLYRASPDGRDQVLCLHNVSEQVVKVPIQLADVPLAGGQLLDLISGSVYPLSTGRVTLNPYETRWPKAIG